MALAGDSGLTTSEGQALCLEASANSERLNLDPSHQDLLPSISAREEWLTFALEATEDGIWDWNIQTDTFKVSERFLAMLGYDDRSYPGPTIYHWLDNVHPEESGEILPLLSEIRSGRQSLMRIEIRVQHIQGHYLWLLWRGKTVEYDAAQRPLRMVGTVTDITDRKVLEQRLMDLLAETQERAELDPLTGLLNYAAFHRQLDKLTHSGRKSRKSFAIALLDVNHFKFFNDAYGHAAGDEVLKKITKAMRSGQRPPDLIGRLGGDEFAMLLPDIGQEDTESILHYLEALCDKIGYRPHGYDYEIPVELAFGVAIYPDDSRNARDLLSIADERLRESKQDSAASVADILREKLRNQVKDFPMLEALVYAVDNKDRYTRRHSEDVLTYSLLIAQEVGLPDEMRASLMAAALIHDVGKIGVPDRILRLPGKLSDEEYEMMKQHAALGAVLVGAVDGLENTRAAVRHHHERWDGRGYPDRLQGEHIPLAARILSVADAFSAMTTDRPYRRGMALEVALHKLESGAGTQWDARCVRALCNALRRDISVRVSTEGTMTTLSVSVA